MFQFGPFVLDAPARMLRCNEREIALQPRVFDLLAYLVQHRERVVSKDELLDALWPGVTVTDNSLQRAISNLRAALREGGMEEAVRNFPKSGYRFDLDAKPANAARPSAADAELVEARQAIQEHNWQKAITLLERVDARAPLSVEDLDRWGLALQCIGRPSDAIPVLTRAIAAHEEANERDRAASSAISLSSIHLERGDLAVAKGWATRARSFVEKIPDAPSHGLISWAEARHAAAEGDPERALKLAEQAYGFGQKNKDARSEALGLMYRGFFRLSLGQTREGLADQDHAATLSLSNDMDPITGGVLYCNILWACRTFGDWARANQWTLGYQRLCTENGMGFSGSCQLHRAEVLGLQGSLTDALDHINDALARLQGDAPWALGDAYRVLGDIQSAIGDTDAASAAYDKAYAVGWDPEPGRAMLLLERGETEAAYASLERSLIGQNWWTLQRQGILRAYLSLVAAHAGHFEKAKTLIHDLAGQDERWPMPSIRALTNEAQSLIAQHRGEMNEALRHLHLARQLWTSVDCRFNAARLRIQIAELQTELADLSGAQTELRAAMEAAKSLQSKKLSQQCKALEQKLKSGRK
jgi:DNA-binding winged helix-turn-helix (wHTH) protein